MKLDFKWIGGACFILSVDNVKIAVDPVLCEKGTIQNYFWFKSERIEAPVYTENDFENVDLWLITHKHEDHLDYKGLSVISANSKVICNSSTLKKLEPAGKRNITSLKWREKKTCTINSYKIKIEAIPAIHGINPLSAILAGCVNGYYITISKGEENVTIYITGDTVYKNRIVKALSNRKIDLLIPNMGAAKQGSWIMTLTLNAKMLKELISKLNPKYVIPVHYGTFQHYTEPVEAIRKINDDRIKLVNAGDTLVIEL